MFRVAATARTGSLRAVRHYFGLSQADIAPFLGLSQVTVAQAESSQRPLPLGAGRALGYLSASLPAAGADPNPPPVGAAPVVAPPPPFPIPPPPDPLDPVEAAALLARQRQCVAQATQARFRLTQLAERAAQARRRLAALPALHAAIGPAPAPTATRAAATHERQHLWLALFENEARQQLARSGATAQALLTLRLAALEHEAAHAQIILTYFSEFRS